MTYFHYYATTSRNLDRVLQYGVFPLAKASGLILFRNAPPDKRIRYASDFARVVSASTYAALTTTFFGLESNMIDANAREAVSAELGVDADKLQFSDYKHSGNKIISKAYDDIIRLQKYRYGTDALFMLPMAMRFASNAMGVPWIEHSRDVNRMIRNPKGEQPSWTQLMLSGHNGWDFSALAGKAGYWAGETYFVSKTGHYEVVKLRENLESTGKDMSANDLLAVYQRTRNDKGLPMIETKAEYDAVRPLLQKVADAYNRRDGKITMSEIVYLIGMGRINVHADDDRTVSPEAVERSLREIDKVTAIGLAGIREENRQRLAHMAEAGEIMPAQGHKSFVDRVANGAFNVAQRVLGDSRHNMVRKRPEEFISVRDPGEAINWNRTVSR